VLGCTSPLRNGSACSHNLTTWHRINNAKFDVSSHNTATHHGCQGLPWMESNVVACTMHTPPHKRTNTACCLLLLPACCLLPVSSTIHCSPFACCPKTLLGFISDELHLDLTTHTMGAGDEANLHKVILAAHQQ
jgi:hypothetical protein